ASRTTLLSSFLFQAEDGIRDRNVTGVQTCALPIYFHAFALCQYLHSFYFLALFDYEIACPLVQLISLFAFYKLHNSYVNRSFLGGTNVRHFCSFPAITSM